MCFQHEGSGVLLFVLLFFFPISIGFVHYSLHQQPQNIVSTAHVGIVPLQECQGNTVCKPAIYVTLKIYIWHKNMSFKERQMEQQPQFIKELGYVLAGLPSSELETSLNLLSLTLNCHRSF